MAGLSQRLERTVELTEKDAQYSVISSASSLINTLLPIIGGSIIDRYGGSRYGLVFVLFHANGDTALHSAPLCCVSLVLSSALV